jgi:site-specific recombinase XerD
MALQARLCPLGDHGQSHDTGPSGSSVPQLRVQQLTCGRSGTVGMASPDTGLRVVREHESAVIMTTPRPQDRQRKHQGARMLQAEISSFRLHLAAGGKSARTIRTYTDAVQWFAAAGLLPAGRTAWAQAGRHDIQTWMTWLLHRYSAAYASNQYRALQQFFRWLAAEDDLPDPMTGLRPPPVPDKLVPVFTDQELSRLEQACAGRTFAQRRDTAIIAVFTATGIRLSELAGISWHSDDPQRSDVDLWQRQITVRGKGGKDRIVKIGHHTALSLDRYLRARSRHAQAWRPQLWLGTSNREPLTASGIYQMITRRGRQAGVDVCPHRFRHHFCHTWLDRGGPEGDLMELSGWSSPQMLRRYGASARAARARRTYDRIMTDT